MDLDEMLAGVRNNRIEFATMRPPGSRFAVLDRQVVVTGPPDLVELARMGEIDVIEELIALLGDPDRAWATEVLLAAMTGREADLVNSFATAPDEWSSSLGDTAQTRWEAWLNETRDRLAWDGERSLFTVRWRTFCRPWSAAYNLAAASTIRSSAWPAKTTRLCGFGALRRRSFSVASRLR